MHFRLLQTIVTVVALCASAGALAQKSWYLLGSMGPSTYGSSVQSDTDADLTRQGKSGISSTSNSNSTGYKAMLGYQMNPNFAMEGGYMDMGSLGYNATFTGGNIGIDSRITGFNFSTVGLAPINYQLSAFGKLGYTLGTVTAKGSSGGTTVSLSQDKSSIGMGIGGLYSLTPNVGLRAEWERLYSDINLLSFGIQVKF